MRWGRFLPVVAVLLCLGCASRFYGDAHADAGYDFSKVRGLALADPPKQLPPDASEVRTIIESELRRQLEAKGYRVVPRDEADLLVRYYAGLHAKVRMSGGATPEGTDARMTLQFLEPGSGYLVWYGWTKATWRESMEPEPEVQKAVTFLLARFPDAGSRTPAVPGSGDPIM